MAKISCGCFNLGGKQFIGDYFKTICENLESGKVGFKQLCGGDIGVELNNVYIISDLDELIWLNKHLRGHKFYEGYMGIL